MAVPLDSNGGDHTAANGPIHRRRTGVALGLAAVAGLVLGQRYELVVTDVGRDRIHRYLTVSKAGTVTTRQVAGR